MIQMRLEEVIDKINSGDITERIILDDVFIVRYFSAIKQTVKTATDFRLTAEPLNLPLTKNDVIFFYQYNDSNTSAKVSEAYSNTLYPLGSTVYLNGKTIRILSYDNVFVEGKFKVVYTTVELLDGEITYIVEDTSKTDLVLDKMTSILRLNNELKELLPSYKYNWQDYTYDAIEQYEKYLSLKDIIILKEFEYAEMEYRLLDVKSVADDHGSYESITSGISEVIETFLRDRVEIEYYLDTHQIAITSLANALLTQQFRNCLNLERLKMKGTVSVRYQQNQDETSEYTLVPDSVNYYYQLNCGTVTRVELSQNYYQFILSSVSLVKIDESEQEEISLQGDSNYDKFVYALKYIFEN